MSNKISSRSALLAMAGMLTLAIVAQAKTFDLMSTGITPAATGKVDASTDRNGNVQVDLKVDNLARPDMLKPPAAVYVVWLQVSGQPPQNEGQLRVNHGLKAELKTATPFHAFEILITAENDPMTKTPSREVMMRAQIQQ